MVTMKPLTLSLLIAAMAPLGVHAQPGEPGPAEVQIELRPQVSALPGPLRLGDLAIVRTRDLAAIQQLVALPVGHAPRPGATAVVRRDVVARWIRMQLGLAHSRTLWTGADESVIRGISPSGAVLAGTKPSIAAAPEAAVPGVARGQWVLLQLKSGPVELERRAQAMQDGNVGETVNVRAENGLVAARVTAPGRVEATL